MSRWEFWFFSLRFWLQFDWVFLHLGGILRSILDLWESFSDFILLEIETWLWDVFNKFFVAERLSLFLLVQTMMFTFCWVLHFPTIWHLVALNTPISLKEIVLAFLLQHWDALLWVILAIKKLVDSHLILIVLNVVFSLDVGEFAEHADFFARHSLD